MENITFETKEIYQQSAIGDLRNSRFCSMLAHKNGLHWKPYIGACYRAFSRCIFSSGTFWAKFAGRGLTSHRCLCWRLLFGCKLFFRNKMNPLVIRINQSKEIAKKIQTNALKIKLQFISQWKLNTNRLIEHDSCWHFDWLIDCTKLRHNVHQITDVFSKQTSPKLLNNLHENCCLVTWFLTNYNAIIL